MDKVLAAVAWLAVAAAGCVYPHGHPAPGALVVTADDGSVVVVAPDGSGRRVLEAPAGGAQPVWSPDGSQVAVSDPATPGVVVLDPVGGVPSVTATAGRPIYVAWPPWSAEPWWLRLDPFHGLALEAPGGVLGVGSPFYFAWEPDGRRWVAHRGALLEVHAEGTTVPLDVSPGSFRAPVWTPSGIVVVSEAGDLVRLDDGRSEVIARVPGAATLVASGDRLAVGTAPAPRKPGGGPVEAVADAVPVLSPGAVWVLDGGDPIRVADRPAVAFFWDPTGRRLLLLDADGDALRWSVWDDGEVTVYDRFVPPSAWAERFLPFFDQYALSMRLWAPDGSAFAFPGTVDGVAGVWVRSLDASAAVRVTDGRWVDWSPAG